MNTILYKRALLLFLYIVIYGCSPKNQENSSSCEVNLKGYLPRDIKELYFPVDTLMFTRDKTNKEGDASIKARYSELLFNLNEPILYNYKDSCKVIRMLWIRPFDNPIVIRLNESVHTIVANVKELERVFKDNNYDKFSYHIKLDTTVTISSEKCKLFSSKSLSDGFWNAPTSIDEKNLKDATFWILEVSDKGKYHCVGRVISDSLLFKESEYPKALLEIGSSIISMENSRTRVIKNSQ